MPNMKYLEINLIKHRQDPYTKTVNIAEKNVMNHK